MTLRWLEVTPMKHPRRAPRLLALDGDRVLVTGGRYPPEVFHLGENAWHAWPGPVPVMPAASTRVQLPCGRVLTTGGVATYGGGPFEERDSSLAECELDGQPAGRLAFARHDHGAVLLPCGAVLVAGGMHDEEPRPTPRVELGIPSGVTVPVPGVHERLTQAADAEYLERVFAVGDWPEVERVASKLGEWHRAGKALMSMGRYREAAAALKLGDGECPFTLSTLADVYVAAGESARALETLDRVIALCEAEPTWTHGVLRHARSQRQYLAPSTYGAPTETSADWNNKGAAHSRAGDHRAALGCFEKALRLDRDNDFALGNRASALLALKRPSEALEPIARAIALREHDLERRADGYLVWGIALFDLGRYAESVGAYDAGIALCATANHWNNRGNSLLKLKRYEDALASFERAGSHWGRASALCALGRLAEAKAAAARAIAEHPELERQLRADADLEPLFGRSRRGRPKKHGRARAGAPGRRASET